MGARLGQGNERGNRRRCGISGPVRRLETRHAAAFLIDEHRRVPSADGVAQRGDERANLVRIPAIALEENESERIDVAKERALSRAQLRAGAAEDDSERLTA